MIVSYEGLGMLPLRISSNCEGVKDTGVSVRCTEEGKVFLEKFEFVGLSAEGRKPKGPKSLLSYCIRIRMQVEGHDGKGMHCCRGYRQRRGDSPPEGPRTTPDHPYSTPRSSCTNTIATDVVLPPPSPGLPHASPSSLQTISNTSGVRKSSYAYDEMR